MSVSEVQITGPQAALRALLIEARSGLCAHTGGEDGACAEAIARIDAVLAAPAGPEGGDGWQPAETAPPNKAVQVYVPRLDYYGNEGVFAGMLVDMGTGQRWMTFAWAMGRDMLGDNRPTHWRPLPPPPAPLPAQGEA